MQRCSGHKAARSGRNDDAYGRGCAVSMPIGASESPVIATLLTREEGLMKRLDSRVMVKNPWLKTQAEFFSDTVMGQE